LSLLEAIWKGERYVYEARPSWWDAEVPLRERAPCVVIPLARTAGQRLVSLVFGESRFPQAHVEVPDEAHPADEAAVGAINGLVPSLVAAARLRVVMREQLEQGLACGSACAIVSLRGGRPVVRTVPARHAWPELDADGNVVALEIRYKFTGSDGKLYWARRTIDCERDVVYEPALVTDRAPEWVEAESAPTYGCVPVVWTRNDLDPTDDGVDGCALHEGLEDELEALDFAASQRHRNAQYNGEPFIVRVLGDRDEDASEGLSAERGRTADTRAGDTRFSWFNSAQNTLRGWTTGGTPAVKKAPGRIVTLSKGGDMKLVESTGAGAAVLQGDADDLRKRVLEAMAVVMADPSEVAANASAALQKQLYAPMLARCDALREVWGVTLKRIVEKLLHLCAIAVARDESILVRNAAAAREALLSLLVVSGDAEGPPEFAAPELALRWGEYFEPTWADISAAVDAAQKAAGGAQVISRKRAVALLAPVVGIEDVDAEVAAIEAEEGAGAAAAQSMMGALGGRG
jgi:hypothetical protein